MDYILRRYLSSLHHLDISLFLYHVGGGWCFNEKECLRRRSVDLGSSANYASGLQEKDLRYFYLRSSNNKGKFVKRKPQGPLFGDWNLAFIK